MNKTTILIIALAIIAFFNTGCTITGNSADLLEQDIIGYALNTDIDFLKINGQVQACHKTDTLYFVVENIGTSEISGFSILLESDYNISIVIKENVVPGYTSQQSLNFGSQNLANVKQLTIYPLVGENNAICRESSITTELEPC